MEQAGLNFVIDCVPLSEAAYVDRDMWEKIVLNLLSNAFKFTLVGGVTVRLRSVGEHIELRVEDTGLGIPADQQSKVFERFHRVEGVRGRTHEGTGIGLALVQELVKLHKGSIRVESTPGKGTAFTVSIPKGHAHLPADRIASDQRVLKSTGAAASAYVDEALRWLPDAERTSEAPEIFASDSVQAPHIQTTSGSILVADDNADMVCNLLDLDGSVQRHILNRYDHQNLNTLPEFASQVPTTENLCQEIYDILRREFSYAHLEKVRIEETMMNSFEYAGNAEMLH